MDMTKTVLVTGAGSGLGYELTRLHAQDGWIVLALEIKISEVLLELQAKYPDLIHVIHCDVGSTESVNLAIDKVRKIVDHIDRLFNNAGFDLVSDKVTLDKADLDFFTSFYNVNAVGPLRVVKAALDLLREGSMIITISSEAGSLALRDDVISYGYCMSKAAMNMGARIMDNWLSQRGIQTIIIHPGRMRSALRGPHSNIDPWESAEGILNLIERLPDMPYKWNFFDYRGIPYPW